MRCAVIAIGDELVTGTVVDENSAWISDRLLAIGVPTTLHMTVGDDQGGIVDAFRICGERAGVVVVTGGLGPTEDDLTRDAFCRFACTETVENEQALEHIRALFKAIGREMTDNNKKQAMIPEGATLIPNPLGTAPGFTMEVEGAAYYFLPGVPRECHAMMEQSVLGAVASRGERAVFRSLLFRTFGMTESQLDQELKELALPAGVRLGYRAVFPEIHLKLIARAEDDNQAGRALSEAGDLVRSRVGDAIYSEDGRRMEQVVLDVLKEKGMRLTVAESCTGGLITKRLTDVPGSSQALDRGFVSYSNPAKTEMLGVPKEGIEAHGAVSEQTALAMARGAVERAGADLAVAVTGIAGPTGGTADKPVGTVFIALADAGGEWCGRFNFLRADRTFVRELTAQAALEIVRRRLLGLGQYSR